MSKTYIILAIVLIGFAFGLILLPESNRTKEAEPEMLLKEAFRKSRFLSPDQIAERLINEDPSILLIDVRTPDQYLEYSLPNAFNIPLDEIIMEDWKDYLDQEDMDVVLVSNGGLYADQAWMLCKRMGYGNLYVMEGGLNAWFKCIMQPEMPEETAPKEAFELYAFRKGAAYYFGGGSEVEVEFDIPKENIVVKKREKKNVAEGGC
jgi:rhodanese-related sulfurtransferase